jgi:hypothetical protein
MATQTVEFRAAPGLSLTVRLFSIGSDTIVQTASSCTEATNRKGTYAAVFTDPGAAEFELVGLSGTTPVCRWFVTLTLTTATFQAYEVRTQAVVARVTANVDQWGGVAVTGMPLPTSSYTAPPTAGVIADAVWDEIMSTHTVNGSYGSHVVRSANQNQNTVAITGSQHIAADVHELQAAVITADKFAANWLTAAGTAADYITELQTAIGTAANQTAILDRVSFCLSALAGNCSDAQTAAETYVLSIGGNTYTVDYSGLDASGNRSTTTLTKA